MAKIEDFKTVMTDKKNFHINMGDKIVVTKENIDFLRQYLKATDFTWQSGHHITDSNVLILGNVPAFGIDRVLVFETTGVWTKLFFQIEEDMMPWFSDAVNYVFVDY